ncbi:DUF4367 domain-containing protein [Paenibacillus gallinarum]|uniref:DUF4367 domain-containing protein n=1 Tax=Paenibacillus gallinarum TaxID=2762232 RepID=A0ABR8SUZ2_9BACL|nr:DUF4367 domain-containing protein [Paenibacillus gallinarum]MBD7967330.1 DUF4367 domain-containing protein [Paenibacillus gallinarum]
MGSHSDHLEKKLRTYEKRIDYKVDVRSEVMNQISEGTVSTYRSKTRFVLPGQRASRTLVSAFGAFLIVILLSFTAYAATEFLQFRAKDGKILLETTAPLERIDKVELLHKLSSPYMSQAQRSVLPSQPIAYYIKDDMINHLISEVSPDGGLLGFQGNQIEYYTLPTLELEAEKLNSPITHIPSSIMEGYSFKSGGIYLDMPKLYNTDGTPNERYWKIQTTLVEEAKADQTDKKLFIKTLESEQLRSISLHYRRGENKEDYVTVLASFTDGVKQEVQQEEGMTAEKGLVNGKEILYLKYEGDNSHQVIKWIDETSGAYYHIHDTKNSKLSKQDFLKIAEEFVH